MIEFGRRIKEVRTYMKLTQKDVAEKLGITQITVQTFAAFCGSSGRSVKIWVLFALPDGSLPKRESEMVLFHAHAYRLAVKMCIRDSAPA